MRVGSPGRGSMINRPLHHAERALQWKAKKQKGTTTWGGNAWVPTIYVQKWVSINQTHTDGSSSILSSSPRPIPPLIPPISSTPPRSPKTKHRLHAKSYPTGIPRQENEKNEEEAHESPLPCHQKGLPRTSSPAFSRLLPFEQQNIQSRQGAIIYAA